LAGVPDIFCPAGKLYIEVKKPRGSLTYEQALFLTEMHILGYFIAVCRSHTHILSVLNSAAVVAHGGPVVYLREVTNDARKECDIAIAKHAKSLARRAAK